MRRWEAAVAGGGASTAVARVAAQQTVATALGWVAASVERCRAETIAIAQVPAPTFAEGERADLVERRLRELGAEDVRRFGHDNVAGRLGPAGGRGIALLAHLDTVFSADVSHTVSQRHGRLYGPGVGDNSAGVAGMLTALRALRESDVPLERPIWFVGNVGEEGLGDLRGAREAMDWLDGRVDAVLAIEGTMLGRLGHVAVGSRRLRVSFRAEGGHSWLDFGRPSAVHAAVSAAARIASLQVPVEPRTTYNVGRIEGGSGVNVIAPSAEFVLDMRSVSPEALDSLFGEVGQIIDASVVEGVQATVEQVGNRPAGSIPRNHPLVEVCAAAIERVGLRPEPTAGSTDANIPLSLGLPALALGITRGSGIHSAGEWVEIEPMRQGVEQLVLICALLAGASEG